MTFDPQQIARLEQLARELDAAPGEKYDDLQQAASVERAELKAKIAKHKADADRILANTEKLWTLHSDQQRRKHRDIMENPRLNDRQRMTRLIELLQGTYDLPMIRHFESNAATYQASRRTQGWFERTLSRMTNES